jgi:hypothetical protein
VRALLDAPAARRPNGVIILDDHLTDAVECMLIDWKAQTGQSLEVVAQCNMPDQFGHQIPIAKLGCPVAEFLRQGMKSIESQRLHKKVPKVTYVDLVMVADD